MTEDNTLHAGAPKLTALVKVTLTGRHCRRISWIFTDFLAAANFMPEMPLDLLVACRSINTFARGYADLGEDGYESVTISMPLVQAHFIVFACALARRYQYPDDPILTEIINAVGAATMQQFKPLDALPLSFIVEPSATQAEAAVRASEADPGTRGNWTVEKQRDNINANRNRRESDKTLDNKPDKPGNES